MTDRDTSETIDEKDSQPASPVRRRIIKATAGIAASGMLPLGVKAQGRVREADIVVIGGGMAGSSTALQLARFGRNVTLLERGEIASEASGQNMGGLGGAGWGHRPNLLSYLTMGSLDIFKELQVDMGYDMEFRLHGSLTAIHNEEQYEYLEDRVIEQRSTGYDGELLSPREARSMEPELSRELLGCMFLPGRGQADPIKSTRAFADAAAKAGASIDTGQNVTAIEARGDGGYTIRTADREYRCQTLVLATGSWCGPVGRMLGIDIPIKPIRGQMWSTRSLPPSVFHTMSSAESSLAWSRDNGGDETTPPNLTHKNGQRVTRHLYGRQRRNGEIIFGGDREDLGFNTTPDPDGIEVNRGQTAEVLPLVAMHKIDKTWAGLMPFSVDGSPIIGRIPLRDNLFIVSGLASSGFGRGPMAGKLAAEYIHTGHMPQVLAESDPARCVTEAS